MKRSAVPSGPPVQQLTRSGWPRHNLEFILKPDQFIGRPMTKETAWGPRQKISKLPLYWYPTGHCLLRERLTINDLRYRRSYSLPPTPHPVDVFRGSLFRTPAPIYWCWGIEQLCWFSLKPDLARRSRDAVLRGPVGHRQGLERQWTDQKKHGRSPACFLNYIPSDSGQSLGFVVVYHQA